MNRIELSGGIDFLEWREGSGGTVEIFDIAVNSKRGCGRGTRLVRMLIERVRNETSLIFAITRQSNQKAQDFYWKVGFLRIGTLLHFYATESEDAVVFGMRLK